MAEIIKARGPRTANTDRPTALEQLQSAPGFPKGAVIHDIREEDGHWLAEIKLAETKESTPPPFAPKDEAPSDEAPDSGPPSEDAPAEEPAEEPKEEKAEEKPKGDDEKSKGEDKKSLEDTVLDLTDLVHAIADKLGVGAPGDDNAVPGEDGPLGDLLPPPEAPPGPPTKPPGVAGPAGPHGPGKKPSVPPLGVTPVGSPAFASTQASSDQVPADHPWKDLIGKVATINVSEPTDMTLKEANVELKALAEPYGYKVRRMREDQEDGKRVIRALVSRR